MKTITFGLIAITLLAGVPGIAHSGWGWLIYHERSFKGRIIDAETKEPIEGAVIVAQYHTRVLGPTGTHGTLTDIQEALTDKNGKFFIPSITKFIHPLSSGEKTFFLIWKPGYRKVEVRDSYIFTREPGTVENRSVQTEKGFESKPVRLGIVELEKLKTTEQRRMELPSPIGDPADYRKQGELIKLINEEGEYLGLKGKIRTEEDRR